MNGILAATPALWYLTRGSGAVVLVLLTVTVALGVTTSVRWASPRWPRSVTEGLHRNVSLLVVAFLALHVATTVVDGYAPIGWLDAVVPFRSAYRPLWLGLGAVALDLLAAVAVTSLLRARLGRRTWRAVHWLAYACWPVALAHGLGTGSDTGRAWMLALDAVAVAAVATAVGWRLWTGFGQPVSS
ncbi:MAG TPA: ferric reductase-like transmembrane domain-containing protein [Actinomycetota bacterium]|nr:ferric reductase-like transmembrane domain-containing protein [Actinomycetota bacterium]